MTDHGSSEPRTAENDLAAIERAMVRIRRSQTRRTLARQGRELGKAADPGGFLVVDAMEDTGGGEATVGDVAERLGADPSRASRMVASAVAAGLVTRHASQQDGRRICLRLTDAGRALAEAVHRRRRGRFAHAMRDWTDEDRANFARLLTRFTDAMIQVKD